MRNQEIVIAMILPYPRSGNTWLRYCIENLTDISTRGYGNNLMDSSIELNRSNKVVLKRHKIMPQETNIPLIFIIRDYKEVIRGLYEYNIETFKGACNGSVTPFDYIENLTDFHNHDSSNKVFIHYEDFIINPKETLFKILNFIEFDKNKLDDFIENIDYHKNKSLTFYKDHGQPAVSEGDLKKHTFSKLYSKENRILIDEYMEKTLTSKIYNKYLKRYKE